MYSFFGILSNKLGGPSCPVLIVGQPALIRSIAANGVAEEIGCGRFCSFPKFLDHHLLPPPSVKLFHACVTQLFCHIMYSILGFLDLLNDFHSNFILCCKFPWVWWIHVLHSHYYDMIQNSFTSLKNLLCFTYSTLETILSIVFPF